MKLTDADYDRAREAIRTLSRSVRKDHDSLGPDGRLRAERQLAEHLAACLKYGIASDAETTLSETVAMLRLGLDPGERGCLRPPFQSYPQYHGPKFGL